MTGARRLRRSPSVLTRTTDRSVVAIGDHGPPVVLRDTALAVWTVFEGPGTVADVAAALAAEYGTDPDTLGADVAAFVRRLMDAGLLEPES